MSRYRKHMEINDIIADEEDNDWSFVPKAILGHRKIISPRYVLKIHEHGEKPNLKLVRNSHLRLKILWRDGTISC